MKMLKNSVFTSQMTVDPIKFKAVVFARPTILLSHLKRVVETEQQNR
jgi:hypothetical protein